MASSLKFMRESEAGSGKNATMLQTFYPSPFDKHE